MLKPKSDLGDEPLVRIRQGLWSHLAKSLRQRWSETSLSGQFLTVAALVVGVAMIVLANWAGERIQTSATRSAAEAGAIFLQGFLEPYIQEMPENGPLPVEIQARLDKVLVSGDLQERFVFMKIWSLNGALLYTSKKNIPPGEVAEEEIRTAASGNLATGFEEMSESLIGVPPADDMTLLEVYAPLYRTGTNQIIAVGEFYQSASALIKERSETRDATWFMVAAIATFMVGALYLIVSRGSLTIARQRTVLERQISEASELAVQNNALRKVAEKALVDASEANEHFLSSIGSDLHDGPIQTLSLLMLSLQFGRDGEKIEPAETGDGQPEVTSSIVLAKSLYAELRDISTGLVLPGIATTSLRRIVEIAVSRHEQATGTNVHCAVRRLPPEPLPALKICCYRVIQEGLSNAFRHAGGKGQRVEVSADDRQLTIVVSDRGPGIQTDGDGSPSTSRMGLVGMQNRIKALNGTLVVRARPRHGTQLIVTLPLDPENP
jgi:signal transduction histidine kinase